jgi:hypothetical protein
MEYYNTKREERLKKNNNFLCVLLVLMFILLAVVVITSDKVINRLEEQKNQFTCYTVNPCHLCVNKQITYINIDDLNKTNPDTFIKNELGEFIKE